MPRFVKNMSRFAILFAVAGCVSGCTGWIERQVDTASRAIDCAVLAAENVPVTAETQHCERHPAGRR
jgi:hypothetical protein